MAPAHCTRRQHSVAYLKKSALALLATACFRLVLPITTFLQDTLCGITCNWYYVSPRSGVCAVCNKHTKQRPWRNHSRRYHVVNMARFCCPSRIGTSRMDQSWSYSRSLLGRGKSEVGASGWAKRGSKMRQGSPYGETREAQDEARQAQDGPRGTQYEARGTQNDPKKSQERPKMRQERPNMSQERPKMSQERPTLSQERPQRAKKKKSNQKRPQNWSQNHCFSWLFGGLILDPPRDSVLEHFLDRVVSKTKHFDWEVLQKRCLPQLITESFTYTKR